MALPRFADSPFTSAVFHDSATDVLPLSSAERFLTRPHPSFVIHQSRTEDLLAEAVHVGWQSILFEGDEPVALLEAAPNPMGELVLVSIVQGTLPRAITAALAEAERRKLAFPDDDFGVVSVPHAGLMAVWLPASQTVISVGPDMHRQMARGEPQTTDRLLAAVREAVSIE